MTTSIVFLTVEHFEPEFHADISRTISRVFKLPVKFIETHTDLSTFYDPERRQYNGNKLLYEIESHFANEESKTIGLFRIDLFIPILTFIFGQAALGGKSGIASIYRLKNEHYGMKQDDLLLLSRFKKIIIHELGHTFGLKHCHTSQCVMQSANYVEEIDQINEQLCCKCQSEIKL
jgi:archaemetzincin